MKKFSFKVVQKPTTNILRVQQVQWVQQQVHETLINQHIKEVKVTNSLHAIKTKSTSRKWCMQLDT